MGRKFSGCALLALIVTGTACGDAVRAGRSPMFLVVNSLLAAQGNHPSAFSGVLTSDVITNVTSPTPCTPAAPCPTVFNDIGQVILATSVKDTTVAPTSNNAVTINRYHVDYTRADGRNTPGVDVPYGFDGAVTATIQPNGSVTLTFELVRHAAKLDAPLVQLVSASNIITTIATVTFYGQDQVGNAISAVGTISIDFGNFGDS